MDKQTSLVKSQELIDQTNSEIDIFQNTDSFVVNFVERVPFIESYEKKQLENEASFLLQSKNSILFYSLLEGQSNINRSIFELKRTFRENIIKNKVTREDIDKMKLNLIKNTNLKEYEELMQCIKDPKFDENMRKNPHFLRYILYHKLLTYLPEKDKINSTYRKFLCPNYSQNTTNTYYDSPNHEEEIDSQDEEHEGEEDLYISDDN
jgi:hypothetical protein